MAIKVFTLGPQRSYSDEAARRYLENQNISLEEASITYVPYASDVVRRVVKSAGPATGIIPIKNSFTGEITINRKLIDENSSHLTETANWSLPIDHVLAAKNRKLTLKKCVKENITVYSHIQALLQCADYIASKLPHAELKRCSSTAQAAAIVSHTGDGSNLLAICSRQAAKQCGLRIIAENLTGSIQSNMTTFVAIKNKRA